MKRKNSFNDSLNKKQKIADKKIVDIKRKRNFLFIVNGNQLVLNTYGWSNAIERIEKLKDFGLMDKVTYKGIHVTINSSDDLDILLYKTKILFSKEV